jgi:hypothetical protein
VVPLGERDQNSTRIREHHHEESLDGTVHRFTVCRGSAGGIHVRNDFHAAATEKDAACAKSCVKRGAAPVFVSGDKVYKIAPDSREKVAALVGEKVTVNGKVDGDTVTIESAEAAK